MYEVWFNNDDTDWKVVKADDIATRVELYDAGWMLWCDSSGRRLYHTPAEAMASLVGHLSEQSNWHRQQSEDYGRMRKEVTEAMAVPFGGE